MKKTTIYFFIALCIIILSSCDKDKVNMSSEWTLYGETYKATLTYYDEQSELESLAASIDFSTSLHIYFGGGRPTSAGIYDLVSYYTFKYSKEGTATLGVAALGNLCFATGREGDKLKVEILPNNKLKVTFTDIEVKSSSKKPTTLSGVLIEQ